MIIKRPEISQLTIFKASELVANDINGDAQEIADCYHPHIGGYELAKKLESNYSWDIDFEVIEGLEELQWKVESIHKKACMQWVIDNNIKPPLKIGTQIKQGVIKGIYEYDAAMYTVTMHGETMNNRHQIIRFEDAIAI
jgi:hypothetical protein